MFEINSGYISLKAKTCGPRVSYFLVPGGCRPGSGPPAQQSLDTLKKKQTLKLKKEYRYSFLKLSFQLLCVISKTSEMFRSLTFTIADVKHLAHLPTHNHGRNSTRTNKQGIQCIVDTTKERLDL